MNIVITDEQREETRRLLAKYYGEKNVFNLSRGEYIDKFFHRVDPNLPEETFEPEIELVQCSRCLHKQMADISQSIAIVCEQCGEVDALYL